MPKSILKQRQSRDNGTDHSLTGASTSAAGSKLRRSIDAPKRDKQAKPGNLSGQRVRQYSPEDLASKHSARKRRRDEGVPNAAEGGSGEDGGEEPGVDTDDEIEGARVIDESESKPQQKRKQPTTAEDFGSTLASLLSESARPTKHPKPTPTQLRRLNVRDSTSKEEGFSMKVPPASQPGSSRTSSKRSSGPQPILSLSRAALPPSAAAEKLERRAARQLKAEKLERQDRARVKDVVEGWSHRGSEGQIIGGLEFEKGLKKTAQRGVIKLFNAILTASRSSDLGPAADTGAPAPLASAGRVAGVKGYAKKDKDNVLGRGGKEGLTREGFLDLIKRG